MSAREGVERSLFPGDQRTPKRKSDYEAPTRIDVELAKPAGPTRIFLGEDPDCEVLVGGSTVRGPFTGVASDDAWSARLFEGSKTVVVMVSDPSGAPRAARGAYVQPMDSGATLKRANVLEDGAALELETYLSGDGETQRVVELFAFVGGELRVIFTQSENFPDGALDKFEIVTIPSKPPSFSVVVEAHSALTGAADGWYYDNNSAHQDHPLSRDVHHRAKGYEGEGQHRVRVSDRGQLTSH